MLARNDADMVLIPEVSFELDGEHGLLHYLQRRVRERGYAVVVVAEGAGQELLDDETCGVSGNARLRVICALLRQRISRHFAAGGIEACLRFIDPSYASAVRRPIPTTAGVITRTPPTSVIFTREGSRARRALVGQVYGHRQAGSVV